MKKGMIFDLDGVIVDTTFYHFKAWQYLAKQIDINLNTTFNKTLKGVSRADSLEKILLYGGKSSKFTIEEKNILMNRKNDYYIKSLSKLTEKNILPGVLPFIRQAKKHRIPCAIASSSKNATLILEKLNIKNYFNVIVDPCSLTKSKPDPEIFLVASNLIKVSPSEAIGFEDSQVGIEALNRANIFSVAISSTEHLIGANLQVDCFEKINLRYLLKV